MGSWNGTCGISQMPITAGTKVKLVIIQNQVQMPGASGFYYMTGYASPISFVLEGTYDDYGSVENIDENELSSKLFLEFFRRGLASKKIKIQPDEYEDNRDFKNGDINYSLLGINSIITILERGRASIKAQYYGDGIQEARVNMGIQMFNSNIVDSIINSLYRDNDWDNKDIDKDVIEKEMMYASVDLFEDKVDSYTQKEIDELNKKILESSNDEEKENYKKIIKTLKRLSNSITREWANEKIRKEGKWSNQINILSSRNIVDSSAFFDYFYMIKEDENRNNEDLAKMFKNIFELITSMISVREKWSAQTGRGSQSFNHAGYFGLIKGVKETLYADRGCSKGDTTYCYKSFKKETISYERDAEYIIESTDFEKDEIKLKDNGAITWEEYRNHFES